MRAMILSVVLSVFLGVFFVASAVAGDGQNDLRKKYALPTHVQLRPFEAPTTDPSVRVTPITVFLEPYDKHKIGRICRDLPLIMDAIMTRLYQKPLGVDGRGFELKAAAKRLLTPINRALGQALVKSVHIESGALAMSKGSAARLPFNAAGCKGIKDFGKGRN